MVAYVINFIHTAEAYGSHFIETKIHDALYLPKNDLIIATQGRIYRSGAEQWTPNFIRQNIEGRVERLKIDCIDRWQLGRFDPKITIRELSLYFRLVNYSEQPLPANLMQQVNRVWIN